MHRASASVGKWSILETESLQVDSRRSRIRRALFPWHRRQSGGFYRHGCVDREAGMEGRLEKDQTDGRAGLSEELRAIHELAVRLRDSSSQSAHWVASISRQLLWHTSSACFKTRHHHQQHQHQQQQQHPHPTASSSSSSTLAFGTATFRSVGFTSPWSVTDETSIFIAQYTYIAK